MKSQWVLELLNVYRTLSDESTEGYAITDSSHLGEQRQSKEKYSDLPNVK